MSDSRFNAFQRVWDNREDPGCQEPPVCPECCGFPKFAANCEWCGGLGTK